MSADLNEALLSNALGKIMKEKGIWVKGDESLLDHKVSVEFKERSFKEGLQKILSGLNHSLVYDKSDQVVGVFIFGRKTSSQAPVANGSPGIGPKTSSEGDAMLPEPAKNRDDSPSPGDDIEVSEEDLENLKIEKNVPTPGGPVEVIQDELEELKDTDEDAESPGDSVSATPEELPNSNMTHEGPSPDSE